MLTLGIDTSNYATSLAVFDTQTGEVVCDSKRFLSVAKGNIGLRQSEALFQHTVALPQQLRTMEKEVDLSCVKAVGVSAKPRPVEGSYMPCFLAGFSAATAFCAAKKLPLFETSHQQGHAAAALYAAGKASPTLHFEDEVYLFHVSGGTTDLLHCADGAAELATLGTSNDLYAGQAVDRLGVKLGFDFPAGVQVSRLAADAHDIIPPKASVKGLTCSLSGLENQCNTLLAQGKPAETVCRYCLECVALTLYKMANNALREKPLPVVFAGGVMSSEIVRDFITKRIPQAHFVPGKFASDNAIGVAILAARGMNAWPNL